MQSTSTQWKQTLGCYDYEDRPRFVPVSYVELEYSVTDPEAQTDASASDNGHMDFSNTSQITDLDEKNFTRFVTLEKNMWALDGTWKLIDTPITEDTGFVSTVLSGDDCVFTSKPVITLSFSTLYETVIPGMVITWSTAYNEFATDYTIRLYNNSTLVKTVIFTGNKELKTVVEEDLSGFNKIEIQIDKWVLPKHRARVEEIYIGVLKVYDKSTLLGYDHTMSSDIMALTLPNYSITFDISNVNEEWNPDNPEGLSKYLIERQKIVARYGYKIGDSIEWIKAGTFFMSGWKTPSNGITAEFTASSLVEFMDKDYVVPENKTMTLYALCEDAFTQSEFPQTDDHKNMWTIDESLKNYTITIPDNFNYTCAVVMQLCANASCCVVNVDRDGIVHIQKAVDTITDYLIDRFVSYQNANYTISKALKDVDVNEGMGVAVVEGVDSGETQKIKNVLIQAEDIADEVASWIADTLENRKTLTGEYRADPRLDALDVVTVKNKYATNTVVITNVKYNYSGAFQGNYTGRVLP